MFDLIGAVAATFRPAISTNPTAESLIANAVVAFIDLQMARGLVIASCRPSSDYSIESLKLPPVHVLFVS